MRKIHKCAKMGVFQKKIRKPLERNPEINSRIQPNFSIIYQNQLSNTELNFTVVCTVKYKKNHLGQLLKASPCRKFFGRLLKDHDVNNTKKVSRHLYM